MRRLLIAALACSWALACMTTGAEAKLVPLPPQPAGVAWPTRDWTTAAPLGADEAALKAAMDEAFSGAIAQLGQTREVVIIQGGRLVQERYAPGYTKDTRLYSWSMAKSVTQALVGVAVAQGRLDIDAPMGSPHWAAGDRRAQIPWRTWLQMTDGQRYSEIGAPSVTRKAIVAAANDFCANQGKSVRE